MARIVGGVGVSHVPLLGRAIDDKRTDDPYWGDLFSHRIPAAREVLAAIEHDVTILVYNDHASAFSMDLIPTFALGVAEEYPPADEGYGPRPVPTVMGDAALGWHLAESLILDEFDITIATHMSVDHGCTVPLSVMYGESDGWPHPIVPLCVNVIQHPPPTALRCYRLGAAIRCAVETYAGAERVMIFGTGGMSHQLQGRRAGLINAEFDESFLDLLVNDPDDAALLSHDTLIAEAGTEGVELVMWLIMRGALGSTVSERYRTTHAPVSNTHFGLTVLEPTSTTQTTG